MVLMSLMSFPSWGLGKDDLVLCDGFNYETFTTTLFTGELNEGSFKNGKKEKVGRSVR